jgi:hypothetical protein
MEGAGDSHDSGQGEQGDIHEQVVEGLFGHFFS